MKKIILIALVSIACTQCKEDKKEKNDPTPASEEEIKTQSVQLDDRAVPERLLTLATRPADQFKEAAIDENLFGKFFCDRASFYIIDRPQNKIYSSHAESITLYCLDGELLQTRYVLNDDIVSDLIRQLGSFKITGLDFENRDVIKSGKILIKENGKVTLNDQINNYELRWTFGDKEIKYRVTPKSRFKYTYFEKAIDYEEEFKNISNYCI